MDLFSVPPTQTVIERGSWEKVNPIAGLSQPFEFEISGTGDQYIDLEETQLYVKFKITKRNGASLVHVGDNKDYVGPVNYTLHSLFKQIDEGVLLRLWLTTAKSTRIGQTDQDSFLYC